MTTNSQGEEAKRYIECGVCGVFFPDDQKCKCTEGRVIIESAPDLDGLIDKDILTRFEHASVMWGDIINAQLIKTNRELIEIMKAKK